MKRRQFITLVGGAAAGWPRVAYAQQEQRKIGVLLTENAEPFLSTFKNLLRQLGYVEGQNIRLRQLSTSS